MSLSREQLSSIASILRADSADNGAETILTVGGGTQTAVVLTITSLADAGAVVSAQTVHGYFELHGRIRHVPVEPDEVIFVAEQGERISGLVVGATGACSLFANVARASLSADFATLEPALLLAAMQLGLTENIDA